MFVLIVLTFCIYIIIYNNNNNNNNFFFFSSSVICTELILSGIWLSASFVSCYHFEDSSIP